MVLVDIFGYKQDYLTKHSVPDPLSALYNSSTMFSFKFRVFGIRFFIECTVYVGSMNLLYSIFILEDRSSKFTEFNQKSLKTIKIKGQWS